MQRVAGLDLSLTSSGIGIITQRTDGTCIAAATTLTSRGKRADGLPERATRIETLAEEIDRAVGPVALAVVEAPLPTTKGGSPADRHYVWWLVVSRLLKRGVPVAIAAPASRAKFATGSGRADKAAVSAAVCRLWPDLAIANSDEADAVALAHAGAVHLDWDVNTFQYHRDALSAFRWPATTTDVAA